jgi:hypothetical protein
MAGAFLGRGAQVFEHQAQGHRAGDGHQDVELERQRPGHDGRRARHAADTMRRRRGGQRTQHAQQRQDAGKTQAPFGGMALASQMPTTLATIQAVKLMAQLPIR